ncbi:MAG: excisionase family DNA-binding protein [Cyclobacteriaceae bacterium]|nr:excisionase family DNA-binding protein [Cyclobacteriaceae bacterium]
MELQLYRIIKILLLRAFREIAYQEVPDLLKRYKIESARQLLTYEQARAVLNISKPTFFKILNEKRLPVIELEERTFRIDPDDLKEFLEKSKKQ